MQPGGERNRCRPVWNGEGMVFIGLWLVRATKSGSHGLQLNEVAITLPVGADARDATREDRVEVGFMSYRVSGGL